MNFGGVGIGADGERVRCWALDDFQLRNVSLLKIDAVRCAAFCTILSIPGYTPQTISLLFWLPYPSAAVSMDCKGASQLLLNIGLKSLQPLCI